ncbi:hypothetical protein O3G_MSEX012495 [Manduca sexta]|uniref:HMG box domain-containing protein n=1 Tax=Manduca sexta TaxID=7130 RepID=A0A922CX43_MANSE|nr:hypothetical protein O3G_MSEX012495 [Manduca sexta]
MPKKPPRNAFYYYMLDFRENQKKLDITYQSLKEVAEAAGPSWKTISPTAKAKYEAMARKERGTNQKFTSTGVPLAYLEQQQKEMQLVEEAELKDIKNIINLKCFNQSILDEDFFLLDVIELCKAGPDYLIGEFTVLQFNLREGIKNSYHEFVRPVVIPIGFAHDVKLSLRTYGLDTLDDSLPKENYVQILANIIDYLKQNDRGTNTLPPIFTMPEKVEPIQNFIWQLCNRAAEDDALFRVYKLDTMFFTLANAIRSGDNEGFPKESLATAQLNKDLFKYTPGLACEHHETVDKSNECTSSRVKRWAYTILDVCCPLLGIAAQPGKHVPHDFDIDSILSYKEEKRERALPSVARRQVPHDSMSSCSSSIINDTVDDSTVYSFNASHTSAPKGKRTYTPLRMPRTDYSQRLQQAPELTETNFPTLGSTGHGRGRGLASSFDRMNLKK